MSKEARIYLSPPHMSGNEQKYITEAFESNWIAPLGPNVDAFEEEIAKYVGVKGAVAVSSGTAAIHLALSLLGIKKGDRVFCSTLTFVASANPILYQDATPVFIDSEPDTWNMSPQALRRALEVSAIDGKLPKAVVVVNLYGQSAKMHEIASICHDYNVPIIEDAAESLGSTYKGKYSGTFGKFGIYSFNGNKIITTSGGGMLVSDDVEALIRARFLATQARDQARYYQHSELGFNYRLSNILAGIGRAQFEVLEERVEVRRAIFDYYYKELMNLPGFQFMEELQDTRSNRWLTALTVNQHESGTTVNFLLDLLEKENIEARPVWKPLHMQPLFRDCEYYPHSSDENVSEYLFENGICLPSGSSLKEIDQKRVIQCIKQAIGTNSDAQHRSDTQILLS
ncbi:aminotransferase class I/II-fold pyridoxal phosphate-dependent enzyme [Bacillaceae bacterium CLA-AA-H227]|uniref:Aminotransferase class I/II-fold pyridoxal phosphate-dependent enzyme n=1 Tax=Robertmurraya yapensis (ex Hitch et al 2024) TaxID=3133160 RepID=A0ACC6S9P0_9BACI